MHSGRMYLKSENVKHILAGCTNQTLHFCPLPGSMHQSCCTPYRVHQLFIFVPSLTACITFSFFVPPLPGCKVQHFDLHPARMTKSAFLTSWQHVKNMHPIRRGIGPSPPWRNTYILIFRSVPSLIGRIYPPLIREDLPPLIAK